MTLAPQLFALCMAVATPPPGDVPHLPQQARSYDVPEDVRAVVLLHGEARLMRAVRALIEDPVARDVELVPRVTYDRAAKQARLKHPGKVTTANRLARGLHLSHAISITSSQRGAHGDRRLFIEVVVARLRPHLKVVMAQRFFLPDRHLTASIAGVVVGRIKDLLLPSRADAPDGTPTP